jgi:ribosomal protein S18 acetylase RimI-like enzyme
LGLLKRSGLFGQHTRGAVIERACTLDELRQAYQLVHQVYVTEGYIHPHPSGMRIRVFEALPEMATFVAFCEQEHRTVGVLSVVSDSADLGLPADVVFRNELDELRNTGSSVCEVTNQAVDDEFRNSGVPTELIRAVMAQIVVRKYDEVVALVSPNHTGMYQLLGFRPIGAVRSYSQTIHDPVVPMSMRVDQFYGPPQSDDPADEFVRFFMVDFNPYIRKMREWEQEARDWFHERHLLRHLFVQEEKLLQRCSPAEMVSLRRRWGSQLMKDVLGRRRPRGYDAATLTQFTAEPH